MSRAWLWLQIIIGWLPIWALFTLMMVSAHDLPLLSGTLYASRMMAAAAVLGIAVHRFTARLPWPHPMQVRFVLTHLLAAALYAAAWLLLISAIESTLLSITRGHFTAIFVVGPGVVPFMILGVWLYVIVAGVTYSNRAAQRAAQIEALAARTQLAALRAQLHPHFLFNALHTVVQLIPVDPRGAVRAAEQLAGALRTAIEEQRDIVPLTAELAFVRRYLAIECIRFGDRLSVREEIEATAQFAMLPSFALQTLVENAVRHGAAPRAEATTLTIAARVSDDTLCLTVTDNGAGAAAAQIESGGGTGLRRLRERLKYLYGTSAQLEIASTAGEGLRARLRLPWTTVSTVAEAAHDE
jgi:signal transduction histidine kinase